MKTEVIFLLPAFFLLEPLVSPSVGFAADCASTFATCPKAADYCIFIDLNDSKAESNCASAANCKTGHQTLVIPTPEQKAEIKRLQTEDGESFKKDPDPAHHKTSAADEYLNQVVRDAYSLTGANATKHIDSLIISGHDGGSQYSGYAGTIKVDDLKTLIPQDRRDAIRSFRAWGCYTAVPQQTQNRVLPLFSNLEYLGGYALKGYLASDPHSSAFLYESIMTEDKIRDAKSVDDLKKAIESANFLANPNETHPGAVWVRGAKFQAVCPEQGGYYYSQLDLKENGGVKVESMQEMFAKCPDRLNQIRKEGYKAVSSDKADKDDPNAVLATYLDMKSGKTELPPSSDSHSSIRRFYGLIRSSEHCLDDPADVVNAKKTADIPSGDDAMMILFSREVFQNFLEFYAADVAKTRTAVQSGLAKVQAKLAECAEHPYTPADPGCRVSPERVEMLKRLPTRVEDYLPSSADLKSKDPTFRALENEKAHRIADLFSGGITAETSVDIESGKQVGILGRDEMKALGDFSRKFSFFVTDPVGKCIPLGWVEYNKGHSTDDRPDESCH